MFILVVITVTARYLHPRKGLFHGTLPGWRGDTSLTCLWSPVLGTKAQMTGAETRLEDTEYSNEMLRERDFVTTGV